MCLLINSSSYEGSEYTVALWEHLFQQEKWLIVEREQRQTEASHSLSVKATDDERAAFFYSLTV